MEIVEKIAGLDILPYKFDEAKNCFVCRAVGGSDSIIFKAMIKIITLLEEEGVAYTTFDKNVQILDKEALDKAGSIVVKIDTNGDVVYFNQYACNVTGYKEDEVLGKNWFKNFIPLHEEERVNQIFKDVFNRNSDAWKCTNTIVCKDKSLKTVDWDNNVIQEDDRCELVFAVGVVAS